MLAEIPSSSSLTTSPDMPTVMCGQFLFVEFLIFFAIFLIGFASNVLFILGNFKMVVTTKVCCNKYNGYLVHCSIANLFLMVNMPFDIISFTTKGSWFFGEFFCSLNFFVERAMYVAIATHILNMVRDAYKPFGFPTGPSHCTSNWIVSLVFMFPLLFTTLVKTPGRGCTRCTLVNNSLGRMPVFQWSEYLYVAVIPLLSICFYSNKYGEHPDYEALEKADEEGGQTKMNLRRICIALATTIFICTSPARLTEIAGGNFGMWPGNQIIFSFIPRLLIYGQTIIFTGVCAYYYPSFSQGAKIAVSRLWNRRLQVPEEIFTEQE